MIDSKLDGVEAKLTRAQKVSAAALVISLDHQKSIALLVKHSLEASAAALLRCQYEAVIRGIWLGRCANEVELENYMGGKPLPPMNEMAGRIGALDQYNIGVFQRFHEENWSELNDLTHTGWRQTSRRMSGHEITSSYSEDEIVQFLRTSNSIVLIAAIDICDIAGEHRKANEILEYGKREVDGS